VFAGFVFIMMLWVYFVLPETKGKSLEKIDQLFGQEGMTDAREVEFKKHLATGGH